MAVVVDLTQAQVFKGVEQYILSFSCPELKDDGLHVIPGYVNDQTLPADGGDFCVYAPTAFIRRGTNVEGWRKTAEEAAVDYSEYFESLWQIDCYSTSPVRAMNRASGLETFVRSEAAVNALQKYSLSPLYGEGLTNLSGVFDSGKYVARWQLIARFGFWKKVSVEFPYFNAVDVRVINVDAAFPPA